jgi:hypothetical protein
VTVRAAAEKSPCRFSRVKEIARHGTRPDAAKTLREKIPRLSRVL